MIESKIKVRRKKESAKKKEKLPRLSLIFNFLLPGNALKDYF